MKFIALLSILFSGMIVDKNTNEPLVGVELIVDNHSYYTDLDGKFNIENLHEGDTVRLKYVSYNDTIICVNKKTLVLN